MKIYLWYSSTSGLALQERARMIMNPQVPQKEEDIAKALESWVIESNLLENHGSKYKLPPAYKLTALKVIMGKKEDVYDQFIKAHEGLDEETMVMKVVDDIRDYANRKRLEARIKKANNMTAPMDIGQVGAAVEQAQAAQAGWEDQDWSEDSWEIRVKEKLLKEKT